MAEAKHHDSRRGFQLERFSFFTDGVFAICITLLVIDIKVPEAKHTDAELIAYLSENFLKFLGFIISFCLIGHYWIVHHMIFGYVRKTTKNLLWINLAFLLPIVFLPFSSGLVGEYVVELNLLVPYAIYVANMIIIGLVNAWLWIYVSNPKREIMTHVISPSRIRLGAYRSLIVPFVFLISLVVSIFFPLIGRFIPITIPIFLKWGLKHVERKANEHEKALAVTHPIKIEAESH